MLSHTHAHTQIDIVSYTHNERERELRESVKEILPFLPLTIYTQCEQETLKKSGLEGEAYLWAYAVDISRPEV